jgi:chromosome segregation protein
VHLKQITLQGFKSFAGSTNLNFEKGITCVVGPNGSGKSNVVDALAWVMGEQGTKSLRGGKMEDVIFAGTASKAPLGRAEVKLTIDNSSGILPIEFAEVTIARTLYRNGTSEYAINGAACRLLDVQELLSDSGLGREMHSIVGQGQLDTVLKANPLERRALIEEAAGVLKYRRRKEKTERKLESMQANLTRLGDLIAEVRRNLRPLGRQAEVAQQAKEIAAEARLLKEHIFARQLKQLRENLEAVSENGVKRRSEAAMVSEQLAAARQAIRDIESSLSSSEFDVARERQFSLENIETRTRSAINLARQQLADRLQQAPDDEASTELLQANLESRNLAIASLAREIETLKSNLQDLVNQRSEASSALEEFESKAALEKAQYDRAISEHNSQKNSLIQLKAQFELELAKKVELGEELGRVDQAILDVETQLGMLAPEQSVSDQELRKAYQEATAHEIKSRNDFEESQKLLHDLERKKDSLQAKFSALGLTLDQPDGAKDAAQSGVTGIHGILAEVIRVDAGYEAAISVALGPLADSVLANNQLVALEAVEYLKTKELGRADFFVSEVDVARGKQSAPAGAISASAVVEGPKALLSQLEKFWIVQTTADARKLLGEAKAASAVLVTRDGDYISERVLSGGGRKVPTKLELAAERSSTSALLEDTERAIEAALDVVKAAKLALDDASRDVKAKLLRLQSHDAELAAKAESLGRLMGQLEGAKQAKSKISQQIYEKDQELNDRSQAIATLEERLEISSPSEFAIDQERRAALTQSLDNRRQSEVEARIALGALQERSAGLIREQESIRNQLATAEQERIERLAAEASHKQRLAQVKNALSALELALGLIEKLATSARQEWRDVQDKRSQKNARLADLRSSLAGLEARSDELGQGVQDTEMRAYEVRLQLSTLSERITGELGLTPDELLAAAQDFEAEEQSIESLESQLRRTESKLSQLGSFNPLALEEFAAMEERHKYLSEQLSDLTNARRDLLSIISDLNEKMQTTFAAAFEDTKKSFEQVFPVLFPGGEGSLSLVGEAEQELGVEVSVRPAGKRIERMSLLSGGERSLAALALLIAIFKARPSPFYVLDEVEAALDDTNLGRLLAVLEDLRETSQLIVVTHQKRTMEIADTLYGVSMSKDGVTQVVGEKLERIV